jgi:hypothetical protein
MAEATQKVYVVLEHIWAYKEYHSGEERALLAFRSRGRAEEFRDRCQARSGGLISSWQADVSYVIVEAEVEPADENPPES